MKSQVVGQFHKTREGLNLKRTLQFATLLGICIWLLYQINHLNHHPEKLDYEMRSLSKRDAILARTVNMGFLTRRHGLHSMDKSENSKEGSEEDVELAKNQAVNEMGDQRNLPLELEVNDVVVVHDMTDNNWRLGTENGMSGFVFDDENGVPLGLNEKSVIEMITK